MVIILAESVIEVEGLTKEYDGLTAVDEVSFEVSRGEIFSLVGPNGAGKTTTVEILECLRNPTDGSARVFGFDVTREEDEIKKRIGVLPQDFNTFERLTVCENVGLMARIADSGKDVDEVLEELDLCEAEDMKFDELSGGMKRRVGIAMALVSDPELLFLDEPTTGLDPQARRGLWDTIRSLKKSGVTVFLTTHYMEEVEELSDRAAIMLQGEIFSDEPVDDLIADYGGDVEIVVKDNEQAKSVLEKYSEEIFVNDEGHTVAAFEDRRAAAEAHLAIYEELPKDPRVNVVEPSMEDVFLRVAGGRIDDSGELVK